MDRFRKMTAKAQQALWCRLSDNTAHIPTQFMIEGDKKEGYRISAVTDELCGFEVIKVRSFCGVKWFIDKVNEFGTANNECYCATGAFAWRNVPMPSANLNK